MLYYNYASENNYLFHKFQTFGLNIGIWMWIALISEFGVTVTQTKYFAFSYDLQRQKRPYSPIVMETEFIYFYFVYFALHFLFIFIAFYGTWKARGSLVVPLMASSFAFIVASLVHIIISFIDHIGESPKHLNTTISSLASIPLKIVSVCICFYFIMFTRKLRDYDCFEQELIENDVIFQLHRLQAKQKFLNQKQMQEAVVDFYKE